MSIAPLPPASFQVDPKVDIFKTQENLIHYNSLAQRCARIAYNILSVIVFPVGICRLIAFAAKKVISLAVVPGLTKFDISLKPTSQVNEITDLHNSRDSFFADSSNNAKQVTIRTADNIDIDACTILSPDQANVSSSEQKWIIFMHGNAGCYEACLTNLKETAIETGANVLSGNYRGIMRSKGSPTCSHDLVLDGEAQVQFLLDKGVDPKNILIHGWSLGGAVGAEVAANHPGMNFCSDRSFSTITEVLKAWTSKPLGFVIGNIAYAAGWKFDGVKNYQKITGKKWIIFSRDDKVIRYSASLYKGIKEEQMTAEDRKLKKERVKLKSSVNNSPKVKNYNQDYKPKAFALSFNGDKSKRAETIEKNGVFMHCVSLNQNGSVYKKYVSKMKEMLNIPKKVDQPTIFETFKKFLPEGLPKLV